MSFPDAVVVALIAAVAGLLSPIVAARLSRRKTQAESVAIEGGATKSLAEAMKIIADEFIRRLNDRDKDLEQRSKVIDELLDQLKKTDQRLAAALEDKQRSLAFQAIIEQNAQTLSRRVLDLEELTKNLIAESDEQKRQLTERDRVRAGLQNEIATLKTIVQRHSAHIIDLQDTETQLKKRIEELEMENRTLKLRLGEA